MTEPQPFLRRLRERWAVRRSRFYLDVVADQGHHPVPTPVWEDKTLAIEVLCLNCRGFDHLTSNGQPFIGLLARRCPGSRVDE